MSYNYFSKCINELKFINSIHKTYMIYFNKGSRNSAKVDYFHNSIKNVLLKDIDTNIYSVKLEQRVKSINSSNQKKCDIVLYKHNIPYIIFPVKLCMSNYKQNRNNYWEQLTGELVHLKWANPNINIIPINILINKIPYLNKNGIIQRFETITYNDISIYNTLIDRDIVYDNINYILDVKHNSLIGEIYNKLPYIIRFNRNTQYRNISDIIYNLIN
jgi:hypothetical protein